MFFGACCIIPGPVRQGGPALKIAVFDMDGTLADNDDVAIEAARDGLHEYWSERGLPDRIPSAAFIRSLVGLPSREYFGRMLPDDCRDDVDRVARRIEEHEALRLARGEGRRFDGVDAVLTGLRADGWRLALVSNCQRTYFEANLVHVLDRAWFDVALCLSDLPTKTDNVREALRRIAGGVVVGFGVMVGDRAADVVAGRANGLACVGCLYGFGSPEELAGADRTLGSIRDLPDALTALAPAGS